MAVTALANIFDGFNNFLSGLGVWGRDKSVSQIPTLREMNPHELVQLYRGDWLARKIIDIPAFDATRAWRSWQADNDTITALEKTEREFGIQRKMQGAMTKARLLGGAAVVLGVANSGNWNDPLDLDKVGKGSLKFVHVVSGGRSPMITTGPLIKDITSPWFGEPEYYQRSNTATPPPLGGVRLPTPLSLGGNNSLNDPMINIHPSRVIRLTGADYPDMEIAPDAWGDSVLQVVYDAIKDAGLVGGSVANLVSRANVNVIHYPGLTEAMQTDAGTTRVTNRFAKANAAQSVINAVLLDKNEDWEQLQVSFAGLPQVLQMYLLIASAAADVPSTRLLSREPAGQNSTGDSDLRNYYDRLASEQTVKYTPLLTPLDEVLIRHTLGSRDPALTYNWNPLWQLTPEDKAKVGYQKAQAFQIDVQSGIMNEDALRIGRENQLIEDGTYPGFEQALEEEDLLAEMGEDTEGDNDNATATNKRGANSNEPANAKTSEPEGQEVKRAKKTGTSDADNFQSALSFNVVASGGRQRSKRRPFRQPVIVRGASAAKRPRLGGLGT